MKRCQLIELIYIQALKMNLMVCFLSQTDTKIKTPDLVHFMKYTNPIVQ